MTLLRSKRKSYAGQAEGHGSNWVVQSAINKQNWYNEDKEGDKVNALTELARV